jgi:hypothetical protein
MKKIVIILILLSGGTLLKAQHLPVHPTHGVYDFLTELTNEGLLNISTVSKPYGHNQITSWLHSLEVSSLNERQADELSFYLKEFQYRRPGTVVTTGKNGWLKASPEDRINLYQHCDSLFTLVVDPIGGGDYFTSENGSAYHWWNGAEASATIGKWALYGSLRDNHQSTWLTHPDHLNRNYGGANFKGGITSEGVIDYWEYRGGVSYDFNIGNIGIYKDHFVWGNNYHGSNILSGRAQSFAHIALNINPVKWFEFRYIHGWLVSEVLDSTRSFYYTNGYGTSYRPLYHKKFIAANLFTLKPARGVNISLGNSIVYDYDNPHLVYFIPVMFYKPVDHHLSSGVNNMNSQMFFDLSFRFIPKTHIYSSLFIDELAVKRIWDPDAYNFVSSKSGIRFENIIPNTYAGFEYTTTNALTFQHFVPTTTFESNRYNLGHYLEDNAKEWYAYLGFRPLRTMNIEISYSSALKGPDHDLLGTQPRPNITPFTPVVWERDQFSLQISLEVFNGGYFRLGYTASNTEGEEFYLQRYTPEFRWGKVNEFNFGLNYGF